MKNILVILILILMTFTANSKPNRLSSKSSAIGIRFAGDNSGSGAEISYERAYGKLNRLEFDLGWNGGDNFSWLSIAGIYQWIWNIDGGFNWYVGPGAQLGLYSYDNQGRNDSDNESGLTLGIGGQIGIEYNFNKIGAPLLISLDTRPMVGFIKHSGANFGAALSFRYTF